MRGTRSFPYGFQARCLFLTTPDAVKPLVYRDYDRMGGPLAVRVLCQQSASGSHVGFSHARIRHDPLGLTGVRGLSDHTLKGAETRGQDTWATPPMGRVPRPP